MQNENYLISIIGTQKYEQETGRIAVDTVGSYTRKNGARFISYREYDDENPSISRLSVLKVEDDGIVTMMRAGSGTRLILEKGRRHLCLYDTGFGHMSMGIFTSEVKNELTDLGGKLRVRYTLDVDSALSSKNELCVEVRKNDETGEGTYVAKDCRS